MLSCQEFLTQLYSTTKHQDCSTPREHTLPLWWICPRAPVQHIQNMSELMCVHAMTMGCTPPCIWPFRLLLKPMTLTLIKFPGIPNNCLGLLLPAFWLTAFLTTLESISHWTYKARTLSTLLSAIYKRKPDKKHSNHYLPRGLRHLKD